MSVWYLQWKDTDTKSLPEFLFSNFKWIRVYGSFVGPIELHKFDVRPIEKTLASFRVENYSLGCFNNDIWNPVINAQWAWLEFRWFPRNFVNCDRNSRKTIENLANSGIPQDFESAGLEFCISCHYPSWKFWNFWVPNSVSCMGGWGICSGIA